MIFRNFFFFTSEWENCSLKNKKYGIWEKLPMKVKKLYNLSLRKIDDGDSTKV
jgi:hypothetical protein